MSPNPKIKIIYVTCALAVGGAEKFLYDLIKHLDKEKFAPAVATVVGAGPLEADFRALGLPIYVFGRRRLRYLGGIVQFFQLLLLFLKEKPQIVHTQLFAADLWGRLAAKLADVPFIVTTEQNINRDQSSLREFLKKLTYPLADRVVAISSAVKKYALERYGVPEEKIEIIPNDVDMEKLESEIKSRESGMAKDDKKIILTVGRLVEQKGQKHLIEAFAQLKEKEECELWIAGEGPLRKSLETLAENLGVKEQVKFLGERSDVPALLARADLFVFPSLWEGLGIAVLEAAAAKVPIVASEVDGILDIIEDEVSGYLVPPADSGELAFAVEKILLNPVKAQTLAQRAYEKVKNHFDVKAVTEKYEKLYDSVLSKKVF